MTTDSDLESDLTRGGSTGGLAMGRFARTMGLQLTTLVGLLAIWEGLTASGIVPDFLMPRASEVLATLWRDVTDIITGGPMRGHFFTTLVEILLGFAASVVIGVAIGALLSEFKPVQRALYPYVVAANATPRIAFAPLIVVWFGFDYTSKIVMAVAIAAFPIIVNTMAGLAATDRDDLRLMKSLDATRSQVLWRVRIPTALPYMFAGFETAMLFSAIGAVIGEFMGGNAGLGYVTLLAQELFRLDDAFSAIALLSLQGFVLHRLVVVIRRRIVFWQAEDAAV
ncbi:MAG: ABC transporter permease subunit [Acidimicrobiia bacterium]|nr:ABC transporter permease subunit [Acidimicrobiia bacterium]